MKRIHPVSLLPLFVAGLFALNTAQAVPPPGGVAPVDPPPYGFSIDGDLMANTPVVDVGDWITNTNLAPGIGGGVLTLAGLPINPSRTFHLRDPYSANDNVFKGGMKWRDDPNLWQWTTNKASSKTDINNALLHLTSDTNGHIWAVVAADRYSTSGDSYIDFEFLQASLSANNTTYTFNSAGTNGGRTVGDLVFSLAFVGGGSYADFFAFRWQTNGLGGYTYADVTAVLPVGKVFLAFNSNTVAVPYSAFNQTTYAPNAFVEAAIDLTALIGNFDQCASFGFNSIMVKTKSSASDTATIEDFITPFQYTLRIGPDAQAGPDQVRCTEGAETVFPLTGSAGSGLSTVISTTWSVLSGSVTIADTNSPVTTARVSSASATLRLTVVQANGCTETDDIVLMVQQPPVCSISGVTNTCPRTTNTFSAPPGMTAYAWSVTGGGVITGPTNQQTVKVVASSICGTNYTLALNLRSNVCSVSCATDVAVIDTGAPVLICPTNRILDCPAVTTTNATGVATATDSCSRVTVTYSDEVTPGCGVSKVIARTWTATDECGNAVSCVQTITVRDIAPPVITCPTNRTLQCPADTSPAANGMATAVDACGAATVTFNDVITTNCGNTFVIARTWTATDLCNNSSSCLQTITVRDTTAPVITCPPSVTLQCPADTSTNANGVATATDACGSFTITYADTTTNGCGGTRTISRRWTATDSCGNSASCTQVITVRDTNAPVITCPPNLTLECPAVTTTNATGVATATDACGSFSMTYVDSVTNSCPGTRIIARRWTATDQCGNSSSCTQTIRVQDTIAPVLTCPPDLILDCPANTTTNATGRATATDACGAFAIAYVDTITTNCGNTFTISRRWTATDLCNNSSSCTQTITVRDITPPVITCPASVTLECPAVTTTNATGRATATDNCSAVAITYSDATNNQCGSTKTITRTWRATDLCGNFSTCVQTITVRDTIPPVITCPANRTLECGDSTATNATGTATATDNCGTPMVTYADTAAAQCPGWQIITRTWTATDSCGNRSSCQQTLTVRDTTPPTVTAIVGCTYSADDWAGSGTAANVLAANYAAVFPQGVTLGVYAPSNNSAAPNGLYWTANNPGLTALQTAFDASGGTGAAISQDAQNPTTLMGAGSFGRQALALTMNVGFNAGGQLGSGPNNFGDLIYTQNGDSLGGKSVRQILAAANQALAGLGTPNGHTLTSLEALLANLNLAYSNCTASTFAKAKLGAPALVLSCSAQIPVPSYSQIAVTESCSSVTLSELPQIITNQTCANRFTLIRTWVATDACSNSASATLKIIVNDSTAPVITCPPDVVLEYPANLNPTNTGTASGTDNCEVVNVGYVDTATNVCGVARIITRTWSAWDGCLNITSCVQTITVRDTTPPVITCPANVTVECGGNTTPGATGYATATDLGGANVTFADTITPGCGGSYTISRRWTATDPCGNAASCTQIISVRDTIAPLITCPANRTLECPANIATNNTGVATASDTCSAVTVTFSDSSATTCGNARVISRTWRATDACGNSSTCVQTITVRDTTPPTLVGPAAITVECGGSVAPSATGTATATDSCNAVTVSYSDSVSNSCGNARVILRRWLAMDSCNNSNVVMQTITVRDTTAPVLALPANRVLNCPGDTRTNNTGVATATDVCSGVTIGYSEVVSNSCGITKTIWRTWTATDQCGNRATGVQTIVVQDTAPTMSCPSVSVQCVDDLPAAYTNLAAFRAAGGVANDPCDADLDFVLVSNSVLIGSCPARMTRVYRVTDDCGLSTQCTQTIVVDDTIAPTLTCLPSVTVECGSSLDTNTLGTVTATDNCSAVVITRTDNPVGSFYNLRWYGSDPDLGTGPYSPTYLRLGPASLPCPTGGRAIDPLRNAVCYAPGGQLDALTSLGGVPLAYGQVVPFQLVIEVSGAPGAEKGVIEVTPSWSVYTTSNDRFGFDTNYMVYCAFVDPADPGSIDPHFNAKVDSLSSYLFDRGSINEQIRGTLRISGLDSGDRIIVEIWMVMQSTAPDHVGGTIASEISSARKLSIPAEDITIGNETISIGNLSKFEPLPPPQPQPPAPPIPPQPPVPPGATVSVIDRTWAATDDCGNRSTCVQRITIRDTTAPTLTAPDLTLECPADTSTNYTGTAIALDTCGTVALSYSDIVSNSCGSTLTVLRKWTATDGNNNTNSVVQTINVTDTTAPTLSALSAKTVSVGFAVVFDTPTATDICGMTSVTAVSTETNQLGGGTYAITRSWVATDICGNKSAVQTQTITVTAPVVPSLTKLTIAQNGPTGVLLRWPTNAVEYRLECAATPDAKRWSVVPITPIATNGECRVYLPKSEKCLLFRLANTPPYLEAQKVSGNLRLTWPTAPSGFQLEASDTLAPGSWSPVAIVPGVSNTLNHVTVPASGAKKFYRLKK